MDGLVTLKFSIKLFMQKSVSRPCQQIQKQHMRCAWVECKKVKTIKVKTIYSTDKTGPFYNMKSNAMLKFKSEKVLVETDMKIN